MTAATENDLKRLEDLILNGQKAIESRLTAIESRFTSFESRLTAIENRFTSFESRLTVIENSLEEIKPDLKAVGKEVIDLKIGQAKLIEKVEGMDERLKTVEGTQRNQVWTLITLLGGSLIAVGFRSFFMSNNP